MNVGNLNENFECVPEKTNFEGDLITCKHYRIITRLDENGELHCATYCDICEFDFSKELVFKLPKEEYMMNNNEKKENKQIGDLDILGTFCKENLGKLLLVNEKITFILFPFVQAFNAVPTRGGLYNLEVIGHNMMDIGKISDVLNGKFIDVGNEEQKLKLKSMDKFSSIECELTFLNYQIGFKTPRSTFYTHFYEHMPNNSQYWLTVKPSFGYIGENGFIEKIINIMSEFKKVIMEKLLILNKRYNKYTFIDRTLFDLNRKKYDNDDDCENNKKDFGIKFKCDKNIYDMLKNKRLFSTQIVVILSPILFILNNREEIIISFKLISDPIVFESKEIIF